MTDEEFLAQYEAGQAPDPGDSMGAPAETDTRFLAQYEANNPAGHSQGGRVPFTELMQGNPNPDKEWARIPSDMAMAYTTGGAATAASKLPGLLRNFPRLAKAMGYGGKALTNPGGIKQAATGGALVGAATSAAHQDNTLGDIAFDTGLGGVAGGVGEGLLRKIAGGLKTDPAAQRLIDQGMEVTTGGRIGPRAKAAEDKFTSAPILGDFIQGAQDRSKSSLNRAVIDDSLAAMDRTARETVETGTDLATIAPNAMAQDAIEAPGQAMKTRLPEDMEMGSDAMRFAKEAISKEYDEVLNGIAVVPDQEFVGEIDQLRKMVDMLPDDSAKRFNRELDNLVSGQFEKNSDLMLGQTFKKSYSAIRESAARFKKSPMPFQQEMGQALDEARLAFRRAAVRQNPELGARLLNADKAYAKYKVASGAAKGMGAEGREFNASQYLRSVAKNTDEGRFVTGQGFNQQLAEDAKRAMVQRVGDSGTTGRAVAMGLLEGGAGLASPMTTIPVIGGLSYAYTKPGQRMLNNLLFEGEKNAVRNSVAPFMGLLSSTTAVNQSQAQRQDQPPQ